MAKRQRIEVQNNTIDYVNKNKAKFMSKIIKYNDNMPMIKSNLIFKTIIQVVPIDTLQAVIELKTKISPLKAGFLVFANSTNPGGRYKEGTPAQEESICRRTNLVDCFKNMKYPIPEYGSFYIKNLSIFRDIESNNYNFLKEMCIVDCVLSAAYQSPAINSKNQLCDGFREKTKTKIIYILNAFLENNVYNIVLGALGCGAFGNPVEDICNLFYEILKDTFYKNKFENIIFAVLKEAGGNNFKTFYNKFK